MFARTFFAAAALALTAGVVAFASPAAAAGPDEETLSVPVRIGDLDLATSKGMARLERRVAAAAERICGWEPPADLSKQRALAECRAGVIADAQGKLRTSLAAAAPGGRLAPRAR